MTAPVAILAIADVSFRERVGRTLKSLRWQVLEAGGGAEALAQLEAGTSTAVIVDTWLPDLEIEEFVREIESSFPEVDLVATDGSFERTAKSRVGRRGELLYALRVSQQWDGAAFKAPAYCSAQYGHDRIAPGAGGLQAAQRPPAAAVAEAPPHGSEDDTLEATRDDQRVESAAGWAASAPRSTNPAAGKDVREDAAAHSLMHAPPHASPDVLCGAPADILQPGLRAQSGLRATTKAPVLAAEGLPEFSGTHPRLLEVSRRVRLVAPRKTPVLVLGPSGTGKELVARALHRLSPRSARPLVALNCAAIPESLLEAELFGHTKGAFTGAVQGRPGRIEAASGGTLFLDEIGEMPLPLQAKLLRFLEAGELQRVGDNDMVKVDVRVIAASHQPLAQRASQGLFRMDLYFRLAVFLIETPALETHMEDLPDLAQLFLRRLTENAPAKLLTLSALEKLHQHSWPGNVRELAHVIERAYILAEERREITADEIEFASFA